MTWEIGPPDRVPHTPGGLYLLVHELTIAAVASAPRIRAGRPGTTAIDIPVQVFTPTLVAKACNPAGVGCGSSAIAAMRAWAEERRNSAGA